MCWTPRVCPFPHNTKHTRQRFAMRGLYAVSVPGDGSCLFHSLGKHLGTDAATLRAKVVTVLKRLPSLDMNGVPLSEWTQWYADMPIERYAAHIARPNVWGGALEMAILARVFQRPIEVYEPTDHNTACRKISEFEITQRAAGPTMRLLYTGRSHYMPLFERTP